MNAETENDRAQRAKQKRREHLKEEVERHEDAKQRLERFRDEVGDYDKDDMREHFQSALKKARNSNQRMIQSVEVRVHLNEDGSVSTVRYTALQRGAYTDASPDVSFSLSPDPYVSYNQMREALEDSIRQRIDYHEMTVEELKKDPAYKEDSS